MLPVGIWLAAILIGGTLFVRRTPAHPGEGSFRWGWLGAIMMAAGATRLVGLQSIPSGAYVDELFTLRNTLLVMERRLDLFGVTPLMNEGWVVTTNLYLTFNSMILRLFGVSYFSVKLFSVIPGVLACGFFYLACTRLFSHRVAGVTGLLFAAAHWHIRLSRYGWDASFLVMTLAAAVWLLLRATDERPIWAYLAGIAAAVGLYSYINGRLCLLALGGYLVARWLHSRQRPDRTRLMAFSVGVLTTAGPLLWYFANHAGTTWVRTAELSIFHRERPVILLMQNIVGHLLMFNVHGGTYARDNYPGLPMLDPLTGILLLLGIASVAVHWRTHRSWLIALLLGGTLAGGIFSVSQEGAPYVYRASAAIVPAMLIAGVGFESLLGWLASRRKAWNTGRTQVVVLGMVIATTLPLNLYEYFWLEPQNVSAARVMSSRFRIIGEAIQHTTGPFYLVTPAVFEKSLNVDTAEDPYARFNGEVMFDRFGPGVMALALVAFSGEYDLHQSLEANLRGSRINTVASNALATALPLPISLLLGERDAAWVATLRERYGQEEFRETTLAGPPGAPRLRLVTIRSRGTP